MRHRFIFLPLARNKPWTSLARATQSSRHLLSHLHPELVCGCGAAGKLCRRARGDETRNSYRERQMNWSTQFYILKLTMQ